MQSRTFLEFKGAIVCRRGKAYHFMMWREVHRSARIPHTSSLEVGGTWRSANRCQQAHTDRILHYDDSECESYVGIGSRVQLVHARL